MAWLASRRSVAWSSSAESGWRHFRAKLHPAERAHVGDDLVFDLDHDLEADPVMTAGALTGISYRIRAFGVHWTVA
jgi:hypothetical protein